MPELRLRGGEVDGLSMHYLVEGRGPVVLLIHGLGGFAESWRHNASALASRATVYAVDLPGFGRSAKPRGDYGLARLARAVHGFLEGVGVAQASLVGHSLGAAVAVTYALMHPARVERLALIGALVPGFTYQPSLGFRVAALQGLGEALAFCATRRLFKAALARCFHAPVPAEVDFLVDFEHAARTGAEARAAWLSTVRRLREELVDRATDYRRALATLDVPLLLIHGRQDPAVAPSHCAEAVEVLPRATVRWLEHCGHFPQIEHAPVVNDWLAEFLVGRPAPR